MEATVWSEGKLDTVSLRRKERMLEISSFLEDLACWNLGMFYKFINLKLLFLFSFFVFFLSQSFVQIAKTSLKDFYICRPSQVLPSFFCQQVVMQVRAHQYYILTWTSGMLIKYRESTYSAICNSVKSGQMLNASLRNGTTSFWVIPKGVGEIIRL